MMNLKANKFYEKLFRYLSYFNQLPNLCTYDLVNLQTIAKLRGV